MGTVFLKVWVISYRWWHYVVLGTVRAINFEVAFEIGELNAFKIDPPANVAPHTCLDSLDDLVTWGAVKGGRVEVCRNKVAVE